MLAHPLFLLKLPPTFQHLIILFLVHQHILLCLLHKLNLADSLILRHYNIKVIIIIVISLQLSQVLYVFYFLESLSLGKTSIFLFQFVTFAGFFIHEWVFVAVYVNYRVVESEVSRTLS